MKTTAEYLDEVKTKLHLPSDYALAKYWHVSKQDISQYRSGKRTLGEERAIEVARIIGIDPAFTLISSYAERAKSDEAKIVWANLLEKISEGFKLLMLLSGPRQIMI